MKIDHHPWRLQTGTGQIRACWELLRLFDLRRACCRSSLLGIILSAAVSVELLVASPAAHATVMDIFYPMSGGAFSQTASGTALATVTYSTYAPVLNTITKLGTYTSTSPADASGTISWGISGPLLVQDGAGNITTPIQLGTGIGVGPASSTSYIGADWSNINLGGLFFLNLSERVYAYSSSMEILSPQSLQSQAGATWDGSVAFYLPTMTIGKGSINNSPYALNGSGDGSVLTDLKLSSSVSGSSAKLSPQPIQLSSNMSVLDAGGSCLKQIPPVIKLGIVVVPGYCAVYMDSANINFSGVSLSNTFISAATGSSTTPLISVRAVPAPSTVSLMMLGLTGLLLARRRRHHYI